MGFTKMEIFKEVCGAVFMFASFYAITVLGFCLQGVLMKVGSLVKLMTDGRIGIVVSTTVDIMPGLVVVLFNGGRHTRVQPYYLEILSEP